MYVCMYVCMSGQVCMKYEPMELYIHYIFNRIDEIVFIKTTIKVLECVRHTFIGWFIYLLYIHYTVMYMAVFANITCVYVVYL